MNATEHIVETYYRLVKKCFTASDIKVVRGNNRQFDLLAINKASGGCYHIEISVTHQLNWAATIDGLEKFIAYKFFGAPRQKANPSKKTDAAKNKSYFPQILETYELFDIDPKTVKRVICIWWISETTEKLNKWLRGQEQRFKVPAGSMSILSFRDEVLKSLIAAIGSSNYDDEVLRTFNLLKQYDRRTQP